MVALTKSVPIFDCVTNDQTMNPHLLLLRELLDVVVTWDRLKDDNYLSDPVDTIVGLTFAMTRKV